MITNTPPSFANAVTPFSPQGRQPVGEETGENRNTPLAPVVETPEPVKSENRRAPDERRGEVEQRIQLDEHQGEEADRDTEQQRRDSDARQRDELEQRQLLEDRQQIRLLSERDREVRNHEQAHKTAGGNLAGAASFTYERGPDGNSYAVGGEVPISLSSSGDPEQVKENAQRVQQAALAPVEPSSQDRRVAAAAAQIELEAQQDITQLASEAKAMAKADADAARESAQAEDEQREETRLAAETDARDEAVGRAAERDGNIGRSIDLNQRLLDIGVNTSASSVGDIVNQQA